MRFALGVMVAISTAALGALILGEYELTGIVPYAAAAVFGVVVAEVLVSLARRHDPAAAIAAAGVTALGLVWAAWIQSGRDWAFVPGSTWASVVVGALLSGAWVRSSGRRAPRSPSA
jgi:ABC-type cobalamin transport system permease subunit